MKFTELKNKNIKLNNVIISGVINTKIILIGTKNKKSKIKLYSNGREIELNKLSVINREYILNILDENRENFIFEALLNKRDKKISIYDSNNGVEELILNIDTNMFKRLFDKFFGYTKNIIKKVARIPYKFIRVLIRHNFIITPRLLKQYLKSLFNKNHNNNLIVDNPLIQDHYLKWLKNNEVINEQYVNFKYNPLISVIVPVYNVSFKYLDECIMSVLNQSYTNFELCLIDDKSTNKETIDCLNKYKDFDDRIKVIFREKNGHISEATNTGIENSKGEFIALLDNDDLLHKEALYEVVKVLNENKDIDMIYTDEDKIYTNGKRYFPHFKPDFSPDTLLSSNYICHFTVLRKSIIDKIGGFNSKYNGAQDYDMFLRFTEKTKKIYHIPKVLYHWRMIPSSTSSSASSKNYAYLAGKKALEDALVRRNINGKVNLIEEALMYEIEYDVKDEPLVSIIIPTKNQSKILENCLKSIYKKTKYKNFEIIVINNNSDEKNLFNLLNKYKKEKNNFKYINDNSEFNYSKLNNNAVKKAKGEYIVLLNNDIEVISSEWLNKMVGYASQEHIGCVGVKLLYPTNTIQHAGVILGLGGVAAHPFVGEQRKSLGFFGRLVAPYNYSAVTAACLMVSKEKYLLVDGLDENLKVAYNDVDFNMKFLEKGLYNVLIPSVKLYHHESISRGNDLDDNKINRFKKEIKYMCKKWDKKLMYDKYYNINLSYKIPFSLKKDDEK